MLIGNYNQFQLKALLATDYIAIFYTYMTSVINNSIEMPTLWAVFC